MNRGLLRHGFVLVLLSMLSGFFTSAVAIPRLALSAHTVGVLSGLLLIALGIIWSQFRLSSAQTSIMKWSWLYSSYANYVACLLAAILGTGKMTPIASAGKTGSPAAEAVVSALLISVGLTSLLATGLSLWGLKGAAAPVVAEAEGSRAANAARF